MTIETAPSRPSYPVRLAAAAGVPLLGLARRIVAGFVAWQDRRAIASLHGLDDAMLSDIGISRADVYGALEAPFGEQPSRHLVARVEERRSAERGLAREARRAARLLAATEPRSAADAAASVVPLRSRDAA